MGLGVTFLLRRRPVVYRRANLDRPLSLIIPRPLVQNGHPPDKVCFCSLGTRT